MTELKPIKERIHVVTHNNDFYHPDTFETFRIYRLTTFIDNTQKLEFVDILGYEDLNPNAVIGKSKDEKENIIYQRKTSKDFAWIKYTELDRIKMTMNSNQPNDITQQVIEYSHFKEITRQEGVSQRCWSLISENKSEIEYTPKNLSKNPFASTIQGLIDIDNNWVETQTQSKIEKFDMTPISIPKGFAEWAIQMAVYSTQDENLDEASSMIDYNVIKTMLQSPDLSQINIELLDED